MSDAIVFTTRIGVARFLGDAETMLELPKRGRHVGRGRHVDTAHPSRPGWSTKFSVPVTNGSEWAIELGPRERAALRDQDNLRRLPAGRRATVQALESAAASLPDGEGWDLAIEDDVEPSR